MGEGADRNKVNPGCRYCLYRFQANVARGLDDRPLIDKRYRFPHHVGAHVIKHDGICAARQGLPHFRKGSDRKSVV